MSQVRDDGSIRRSGGAPIRPVPDGRRRALEAFSGPAGRATLALIGLRMAYAYNWFDLGPALPAIGQQFGVGTAEWGLLLAAFFVGAGLFQVPAGLLARRYGIRSVAFLGATLLGTTALLSAAAPNFASLLVLRGVSGAGAGLFFSPAIALVSELHPEGSRGVPVGVFSSAYSAGAGLGVFVSALLLAPLGWRGVLATGGLSLLVLLPVAYWVVPRSAGAAPAVVSRGLPRILRSRAVWAIGLAFMGLEGASLSSGQFFVPYAEAVRAWTPALAGAIGALFVFPSFFGGPVGGYLAERFTNRRTQFVVFTAVPGALLALVPVTGIAVVAVIGTFFALSYGMVYAMMYILPPYLPGVRPEELSLSIGLFNGIQLAGGAFVAAVVGWVVSTSGYTTAWTALAVATVATLAFLVGVPATGARTTPAGTPPSSRSEPLPPAGPEPGS